MCFAGDALICVFRSLADPNGLNEQTVLPDASVGDTDLNYCLRALQCASELKKRENQHLACHIAVTAGDIKLAILGGYNDEWSYIINGSCLSDLSSCIEDAPPKQVVCSRLCYDIATGVTEKSLEENANFDTRRKDLVSAVQCPSGSLNFLIKSVAISKHLVNGRKKKIGGDGGRVGTGEVGPFILPNQSTDTLDGKDTTANVELTSRVLEAAEYFVSRPALSAIYSSSLDSVSELRHVTTMFLRLDSYSPVLHHDPISLQPFFFLLQQVLDETGGFLRQFLVDDKVGHICRCHI